MTIEIYALVDSEGEYWVGNDEDNLYDSVESHAKHPTRLLKITVEVPTPEPVNLSAVVRAEAVAPVPVEMTVTDA